MHLLSVFEAVALFSAAASSYAITGPTGGVNVNTGERPFRQEISNFQNSGPAWDLYILAFQKFTQTDQAQQLSYYQVAGLLKPPKKLIPLTNNALGVHGRPYIPWDGVAGNYQAVSNDRGTTARLRDTSLLVMHIAPIRYRKWVSDIIQEAMLNSAHYSGLLYSWIDSVSYMAPSLPVTL